MTDTPCDWVALPGIAYYCIAHEQASKEIPPRHATTAHVDDPCFLCTRPRDFKWHSVPGRYHHRFEETPLTLVKRDEHG